MEQEVSSLVAARSVSFLPRLQPLLSQHTKLCIAILRVLIIGSTPALLHAWLANALRFFLAIQYSHHEDFHFLLNVIGLLLCIIPKFPGMEGVRLFQLNKY